jgi:hypothetical protein
VSLRSGGVAALNRRLMSVIPAGMKRGKNRFSVTVTGDRHGVSGDRHFAMMVTVVFVATSREVSGCPGTPNYPGVDRILIFQ